MRRKIAVFILAVVMSFPAVSAFAAEEPGYFAQFGKTFGRGFKNILSFPWELPRTIGEYDRGTTNNRVFRDTAGFVDGVGRTVTRLGCGLWDVVFSFVPGEQDGLPLKPETFF